MVTRVRRSGWRKVKEEVMDEEDSADCADHDTTMDNNTATAAESFVWGHQSRATTPHQQL